VLGFVLEEFITVRCGSGTGPRAFFNNYMAKSLITLRNDTRHYLDENTQADWLDTDLTRIINKHYHRVVTAVMETFENYYMTEATADTIANQQEYALPSDFFKLRRVEINYDIVGDPTSFMRALPSDLDQVRNSLSKVDVSTIISRNPNYYIQGSIIGFLPIPNKNGDEAIKIWYIRYLTDLVSDSETLDIPYPDRYFSIITKATAAEALRKGQQEPIEAKRLEDEAQKDIDNMKRELEDRIAEESKTIIDTSGENLNFGDPYL